MFRVTTMTRANSEPAVGLVRAVGKAGLAGWCCLILSLYAQQAAAQGTKPATSAQETKPPAAAEQIKPPAPFLVTELLPGMTQISGKMSPVAAEVAVSVRLYVNQQLSAATASINREAGEFSFQLPQGLNASERLEAQQVVNGVESPRSPAKTVPDVVPKISPAPQEGDKQVSGTAQKGIETVEVTVTAEGGAAKETAKGKVDGEGKFQVSLQAGLAAKDQVGARVPGGTAAKPVEVKAIETKQLVISSVTALQGDKKVTVYFEPLPDVIETATVEVQTGVEKKKVSLTADQRKGNKIEVAFDNLLTADVKPASTCTDALLSAGAAKATLSGSAKGIKVGPGCMVAKISIPVLRFGIPLREGDKEVSGDAGPSVKKVLITVHQGVLPKRLTEDPPPEVEEIRALGRALNQKRDTRSKQSNLGDGLPEQIDLLDQAVAAKWAELLPVSQQAEAEVEGGRFTAKLDRPLTAGEWVTIRQVFPDAAAGKTFAEDELQPTRVDSVLLDWGRFRAVFSTGAAVGLGSNSSSDVDPYIGFSADSRIAGNLLDKSAFNRVACGTDTCDGGPPRPGFVFADTRWGLHTFVDTRLTQATKATPAPATEGNGAAPATPANTVAQTVKATPVSSSLFQFGAYVPLSFKGTDWVYQGAQYSFFAGPLFKAGFQTLDDGVPVRFVTTVEGAGEEQTTDEKVTDQRKGLLPFWGFGARFGFQKFDLMGSDYRNRQVSADLIGYLDLAFWGKHAAYRTYLPGAPVTLDGVTTTVTDSRLDHRIALEARLKIPFTPAFIGVDANMSTDARDREPNDVRFLVGFRVDANKALGKIFGKQE